MIDRMLQTLRTRLTLWLVLRGLLGLLGRAGSEGVEGLRRAVLEGRGLGGSSSGGSGRRVVGIGGAERLGALHGSRGGRSRRGRGGAGVFGLSWRMKRVAAEELAEHFQAGHPWNAASARCTGWLRLRLRLGKGLCLLLRIRCHAIVFLVQVRLAWRPAQAPQIAHEVVHTECLFH